LSASPFIENTIELTKDIDKNAEDAITSNDALQALRLSVGLTRSDGTASWKDYVSADFNKDGKVTSVDALNILNFSVGLDGGDPEWLFIDNNKDYSQIDEKNTSHSSGVVLTDSFSNTAINIEAILLGDVNSSFIA
jgi:hypothetical protein